jgi:tetratricopeptide (TPR) repeat protein
MLTFERKDMDLSLNDALQGAQIAFDKGDLQRAQEFIQNVLNVEPDHRDALHLLALTNYRLGSLDKALALIQECLRTHPDFAIGFNSLAVIFRDLGQLEPSANACLQALKLSGDYAEAYYNLGNAKLLQGFLTQAKGAFLSALQIRGDYGLAHLNLGIVYQQLGEIEQAIRSFETASKLMPGDSRVYLNMGNAFSTIGKNEEAESSYKKGLEITPEDPNLHYHLALCRKHTQNDEILERAKKGFHKNSNSDEEKILLGFALGMAHEDLKDYEQSFHYYSAANRLQNSLNPFEIKNLKIFLENIRKVFSDWLPSQVEISGEEPIPVFIVGMPRSGTTLVEQILSSHQNLGARGELDMLARIIYQTCQVNPDGFPFALKGFSQDVFEAMREQYLKVLCALEGSYTHFTDKMPHNFLFLGIIRSLFPRAKIIHCRRDPLDLCLSCFKHHFTEKHTYAYSLRDLGLYYRFYEKVMEFWEEIIGSDLIFSVDYEELVFDQEAVTRELLDFCGLEFQDACLSFFENLRPVHTASMNQVRQPIYNSSVAAWKNFEPWIGELKETLKEEI